MSHEIVTVEDILAKMRSGTKEFHEVSLRSFKVMLRILSIDEMNLIRRDSLNSAIAMKGDETDKNLITQKTVLMMASTPRATGSVPSLPEKLLGLLTTDEIGHLYNEYIAILDKFNPAVEQISHEAFRELVDALKKNLLSVSDLSLWQLKAICSAYVDLISRTDSSPGTQL